AQLPLAFDRDRRHPAEETEEVPPRQVLDGEEERDGDAQDEEGRDDPLEILPIVDQAPEEEIHPHAVEEPAEAVDDRAAVLMEEDVGDRSEEAPEEHRRVDPLPLVASELASREDADPADEDNAADEVEVEAEDRDPLSGRDEAREDHDGEHRVPPGQDEHEPRREHEHDERQGMEERRIVILALSKTVVGQEDVHARSSGSPDRTAAEAPCGGIVRSRARSSGSVLARFTLSRVVRGISRRFLAQKVPGP